MQSGRLGHADRAVNKAQALIVADKVMIQRFSVNSANVVLWSVSVRLYQQVPAIGFGDAV